MITRLQPEGIHAPVHAICSARSARSARSIHSARSTPSIGSAGSARRAEEARAGRQAGSGGRRRSLPALPLALAGLAAVPASLALEREARADGSGAPDFGRRGQVVLPELAGVRTGQPPHFGASPGEIGSAAGIGSVGWGGAIGYNKSSYTTTWGAETATPLTSTSTSESFWFAPAVDVFVARRVSIGVAAGVLFSRSRFDATGTQSDYEVETLSVAAAPRVGYVVPLGQRLSFWPRLGLALSASEQSGTVAPDGRPVSWTGRAIAGELDLALVYHPHRRLMLQVAPQLGVGHSTGEGPAATSGTWLRVGGEATAGLVF